MSDVTRILSAIEQGDPHAAEQLLPLVYEELRRLAAEKMAQEQPGQTLQATALVHEAYLRLVDVDKARHWNSCRHFFAAAAEAMRYILVDRARRKRSRKRGGDRVRVEFDPAKVAAVEDLGEVLAVDEALTKLATADPGGGPGPATLLRRPVHSRGGRGPESFAALRRPPLGLCPCLAAPSHRRIVTNSRKTWRDFHLDCAYEEGGGIPPQELGQ
jgi:RNA polymerase sigma factor (TIGR02999 family)